MVHFLSNMGKNVYCMRTSIYSAVPIGKKMYCFFPKKGKNVQGVILIESRQEKHE